MLRGPPRMALHCGLLARVAVRWLFSERGAMQPLVAAHDVAVRRLFSERGAMQPLVAAHDVAVRRLFAERGAVRPPVAAHGVAVRRLFAERDAVRRAPLERALPDVPSSVLVNWR
jgi:hypothetical protein